LTTHKASLDGTPDVDPAELAPALDRLVDPG
jgi:hypothetical protein